MSISETWLSRLGRRAAGLILAQDCLLCGTASGDDPLCGRCIADLPGLGPACPVCAMPSPGGMRCGACLRRPPNFDATIALWQYSHPVNRLIQALKFHGRFALAGYFARELSLRANRPDLLLPMPLHSSRLAERGFNQAVEIARPLARRLQSSLELQGALRIRPTPSQADLPLKARLQNVRGAFSTHLDLAGMRVAVVDDVMTTGSTLDELAGVLKRAGASHVENWIVARTCT